MRSISSEKYFNIFLLQTRCLLAWSSTSHLPLCILFLIGFLKFFLFLQIGIHVFEHSAFWNPFIPVFIPTTVMNKVFHLLVLYGNLYTLCFIKERSMKTKHSFTLLEFGLGVLLVAHSGAAKGPELHARPGTEAEL